MVTFSKIDLDFERKTTAAEFPAKVLCREARVKANILKLLELSLCEPWVAGNQTRESHHMLLLGIRRKRMRNSKMSRMFDWRKRPELARRNVLSHKLCQFSKSKLFSQS